MHVFVLRKTVTGLPIDPMLPPLLRKSSSRFVNFANGSTLCITTAMVWGAVANCAELLSARQHEGKEQCECHGNEGSVGDIEEGAYRPRCFPKAPNNGC